MNQPPTTSPVSRRMEGGSALPTTLLLTMLVMLLGLALLGTAELEMKTGSNHAARVEALYIAEAGAHRALDRLNEDYEWRGDGSAGDPAFLDGDNEMGRGRYIVTVTGSEDDASLAAIDDYAVRIESTGVGYAFAKRSLQIVAKPKTEQKPILEFGVFACGNIYLRDNTSNQVRKGDIFTNGNLVLDRPDAVLEADIYARGNVHLAETGSVSGSEVRANGDIECQSSSDPNIDGDAFAGGTRCNPARVTGDNEAGVDPLPVDDLCADLNEPDFAVTTAMIDDWRSRADTTIYDNVTLPDDQDQLGDPVTGIIHVTGNLLVQGATAYTGDAILVVDGSIEIQASLTREDPAARDVLMLVTEGTIEVEGGGTIDADAVLYTTGNIYVRDNSTARIRGGAIAWGNVDTQGGTLDLEYVRPTNPEVLIPGTYAMLNWLEVRK